MLPSLGYLKSINCPFYQKGLCERPYCHFRHVKKVPDVIESVSCVLESSNINSCASDPNILKVVDDEIEKVKAAVQEEKARLNNLGLNSNERPEDDIEYKNCWAVPNFPKYKPTPIKELEKLKSSKNNQYDSSKECKDIESTPYLPQNSHAYSTKNIKLSYMPTRISTNQRENDDAVVKSLSSYVLNSEYHGNHSTSKQEASLDNGEVSNKHEPPSAHKKLTDSNQYSSTELEPTVVRLEITENHAQSDTKEESVKNDISPKEDSLSKVAASSSKTKESSSSKFKHSPSSKAKHSSSSKTKHSSSKTKHSSSKTKHSSPKTKHNSSSKSKHGSSRTNHSSPKTKHSSSSEAKHSSSKTENSLKHNSSSESSSLSKPKHKLKSSADESSDKKVKNSSEKHSHSDSSDKKASSASSHSKYKKSKHSSSSSNKYDKFEKKVGNYDGKKRKHCSTKPSEHSSSKKQKLSSSHHKSKAYSSSSLKTSHDSKGKLPKESHCTPEESKQQDEKDLKELKVLLNNDEKAKNGGQSNELNSRAMDSSSSVLTEEDGADFIQQLGKRRTAHEPGLVRASTLATSSKPKISPAQVMHNRFAQLQMSSVEDNNQLLKKMEEQRSPCIPASMMAAIVAKQRRSCLSRNSAATPSTVASTIVKGSKRIAHLPAAVIAKRPTIPSVFGSKVPSNIRQRYLNIFIDECLKLYPEQQDAFDRALEEEKNAYNRSASKTVYLNVVVNATKKLRSESKHETGFVSTAKVADGKNPKVSHEYNLGGAQAARVSYSIERNNRTKANTEITDTLFYEMLKLYILDEKQLEDNMFPRPHPSSNTQAVILNFDETKKISSVQPLLRKCSRCQKEYSLNKYGGYVLNEQCVFHWGKLFKQRTNGEIVSSYSCCQGEREAEGCSVAKGHVDDRINVNELHGFTQTVDKGEPEEDLRVYAVDCEMCYSATGMELTRVTVIDRHLDSVYESLVRPPREIIDYNTRFSGITEKDLEDVYTTLENVQSMLLDMFSSKTILIGHSLNSDLLALKMIHNNIVDTSIVFPHRRGFPFKRALRTIMAEYLMKIIQNDVDGHDSNEDAKACMELMLWKIKEDLKKRKKPS